MLALDVEYLTGTVIASRSDDEVLDWPPQPDRVFSALVASWGAHERDGDERTALEWLEQQPPPRLLASGIAQRSAPVVFVPPNDFRTSKSGLDVIPTRRARQARRFAAGRPESPTVRFIWETEPDESTYKKLDSLARDTSYVGHSTSLTRCQFVRGDFDASTGVSPRRRVYKGRLRELERCYDSGRRPNPGAVVDAHSDVGHLLAAARSVFSDRWIVLAEADDPGLVPDLRAFPIVARKVRDALIGAQQRVSGAVPEWVSGHREDGTPTTEPHLAVVPLANVGWTYSDGRLLGCAIVMPRELSPDLLYGAIEQLMETRADRSRNIELHYDDRQTGRCWYLQPSDAPEKASQRSERWLGNPPRNGVRVPRMARLWSTATPIALDHYPKKRDGEARTVEISDMIASACVNIGLPPPAYVRVDPTPVVPGAPPASVRRGAMAWQRWRLPASLSGRCLTHAVIGFDRPVQGPVILGAGRFVGLGLCLPLDEMSSP